MNTNTPMSDLVHNLVVLIHFEEQLIFGVDFVEELTHFVKRDWRSGVDVVFFHHHSQIEPPVAVFFDDFQNLVVVFFVAFWNGFVPQFSRQVVFPYEPEEFVQKGAADVFQKHAIFLVFEFFYGFVETVYDESDVGVEEEYEHYENVQDEVYGGQVRTGVGAVHVEVQPADKYPHEGKYGIRNGVKLFDVGAEKHVSQKGETDDHSEHHASQSDELEFDSVENGQNQSDVSVQSGEFEKFEPNQERQQSSSCVEHPLNVDEIVERRVCLRLDVTHFVFHAAGYCDVADAGGDYDEIGDEEDQNVEEVPSGVPVLLFQGNYLLKFFHGEVDDVTEEYDFTSQHEMIPGVHIPWTNR